MSISVAVAIVVAGLAVGLLVIGIIFNRKQLNAAFETAQAESKIILEEARKEADQMVKSSMREAKEESRKKRKAFEDEMRKKRSEINKLENKIKQREQTIDKKLEHIEKREEEIEELEKKLIGEERKHHRLIAECELAIEKNQKTLQEIANMSVEEAKKELISSLEEVARKEAQESIRQLELETRKEAEAKARSIVSLSVQRLAGEYVNDSTVSVVQLPSEEMKGRIIGREGRNIRAIELGTGVDLIIDDTPEAVIVSCFNPVRREIAKTTIERLVADGRIHPARIDETIKRVESEFNSIIRENGEQAAFEVGITDLHPELLSSLGKLKYRTVGLQNVLQHSIETANIAGMLAAELGINIKRAKRAGLLHDIGKSISHEAEGRHSELGAQLCEKHGEHKDVIEAILQHHTEDLQQANALSVAVYSANKLSSSRPGARKEVMESYIKRLEDMETVIKDFSGIEQVFVLQAGREVRAMVTPENVNDTDVVDLSNDIASKLRSELTFPGQVKVTVVRESIQVDFAK